MADPGLCQLFVLLDLADEVHGATDDALKPFGLSRATFQALFSLGHQGPQSHKTLAEHTNCGRATSPGSSTASSGRGSSRARPAPTTAAW